MPSFKGKKDGNWVEASAIYGKSGGSWLYAKEAFVKKDGSWQRAWTDCRQHDATGGRDWSSSSSTVTVSCGSCDSCGTTTKNVTTVTYTKTGCTTYTRSSETGCTSCGTWNPQTGDLDFQPSGGKYYFYDGTPGYYVVLFDDCRSCPAGCFTNGHYYITRCSVTNAYRITSLSCDACIDFGSNPC